MCVGVGEVLSAVGRAVRPEAHILAALNSERICPGGIRSCSSTSAVACCGG